MLNKILSWFRKDKKEVVEEVVEEIIEDVVDEVEEKIEETARHIKGVTYDKSRNKWVARISINGKRIYLGRFDTIAEAEKARKEAEENLK